MSYTISTDLDDDEQIDLKVLAIQDGKSLSKYVTEILRRHMRMESGRNRAEAA
jgi:plasmid stability protein